MLAVAAGLIGIGFKTFLYWLEDFVDELWKGRPEWARPAVGGIALGVLLLAVPQMYGVGYPVMNNVIGGHVVVGLILLFLISKVLATSLTLSIGGSGGVFAPSLFIGAMAGMAFGTLVHSLFGSAVGPPALYAVVAMGGVFAAAAQAPLTAIASVAEMTANFGITLPIMLTCGIAAAVSKYISYGSVYTTKLLRRGIDIERPKTTNVLQTLTVADALQSVSRSAAAVRLDVAQDMESDRAGVTDEQWERLAGPVTDTRQPQELFSDETLEHALRQLALYGPSGLPVLADDREHVQGWITRHNILDVLTQTVQSSEQSIEKGALAADFGADDPSLLAHRSSTPLTGYEIVEITIGANSPAFGRQVDEISWPAGCLVLAVTEPDSRVTTRNNTILREGERVLLLAPVGPRTLPQDPISAQTR
jgi:CIC family chloride channel protein